METSVRPTANVENCRFSFFFNVAPAMRLP